MARELIARNMSIHDKSNSPNFGLVFFCRFDINHEDLFGALYEFRAQNTNEAFSLG